MASMTPRVLVISGPLHLVGDGLWRAVGKLADVHLVLPDRQNARNRIPVVNDDLATLPLSTAHVRPVGPLARGHASWWYSGLRQELSTHEPDLIHVLAEPWSVPVAQALHVAGSRVPVVAHGAETIYEARGVRGLARRTLLDRARDSLAGFVGWSPTAVARFESDIPPRRRIPSAVIPGELPDPVFYTGTDPSPSATRPFKRGRRPTCAFVGRLSHEKGLEDLLTAVAPTPFALDIVGTGPQAALAEQAAREMPSRVQYRGVMTRAQLRDFFGTIDVLVVPSITTPTVMEQFGRVVLEASLAGVPVLTSDAGELARTNPNPDLVYPERDRDSLRDHLQRLAADPEYLRDSGRRSRAEIRSRWDPGACAADLTGLWRDICDSWPGTAR